MNKKSFRVVLLTYFAVAFFVIMAFGSEYLSECNKTRNTVFFVRSSKLFADRVYLPNCNDCFGCCFLVGIGIERQKIYQIRSSLNS